MKIYKSKKELKYFDPKNGSFIATGLIKYPKGSLLVEEDVDNYYFSPINKPNEKCRIDEQDLLTFLDEIESNSFELIYTGLE